MEVIFFFLSQIHHCSFRAAQFSEYRDVCNSETIAGMANLPFVETCSNTEVFKRFFPYYIINIQCMGLFCHAYSHFMF